MSFEKQVAFITGGGSGIGEATAIALAQQGASVVVADLNVEHAQKVATRIQAEGFDALAVELDISNFNAVDKAFQKAEEWKGKSVDILVNSAGIMLVNAVLDFEEKAWTNVMNVNISGTFFCSQRAAREMAKQKYGRIVNLASVSAERAGIGRVAYGTSKAAIAGLTRQLAMELGAFGITANSVAPGPVLTAMTAANYNDATKDAFTSMIPARRLGTLDDMTDAILFLASKSAGYINGILLPVDGGYLASGVSKTASLGQ